MTDIDFSKYFYYDETSPSCLRWKVDRMAGKNHNMIIAHKDSVAGWVCTGGGYWRISAEGKKFSVHRVVWSMLVSSPPPNLDIDHINKNKTDNRISNLRLVTEAINSRNTKRFKSNTTGVNGVCYRGGKYPAYRATWITLDFIRKEKHFSCEKYGEENAFKFACEFRKQMIELLNSQGAQYSEHHGI